MLDFDMAAMWNSENEFYTAHVSTLSSNTDQVCLDGLNKQYIT